jgi:DNA polymerase-3 subunit gamma/tau
MAYEVIARKWRPQRFDDVVGQEHVTRTLKNAIESNRIAHAYLFVGSRGIGKTSVARIFAKALNCKNGPTTEPCGNCDSCREIANGTSLDVLEIDGASNNSVDQIRDLRETVKYLPAHGKFKIYIIDEVHMLSTAAFNALLKTLEEPPAYVKFFFATTEPEKVLATIVSRCQRFDLRRIPVPLLVERLGLVAKSESVEVSDDALLAIARGAEGGMRDAESALDQLISFKGNKIVEDDVLSVFGLVAQKTLDELAEKILTGDVKSLLRLVAELDRAGKDLQRLVLELMEHFRNLIVCLHVEDVKEHMDLTDSQIESLRKQSKLADSARVLRVTGILGETEERMKKALSRRTLLEMALIRSARAVKVVSLEEMLAKINSFIAGQAAVGEVSQPVARKSPVGHAAAERPGAVAERSGGSLGHSSEIAPSRESDSSDKPEHGRSGATDEIALLLEKWPDILSKIAKVAPFARNTLRDARPLAVEGDKVIVALDAEFAGETEKTEATRNRIATERVLGSILKRNIVVEFRIAELDANDNKPDTSEPVPKPDVVVRSEPVEKAKTVKADRDLEDDPIVKKTQDLFGGRIIDIRK